MSTLAAIALTALALASAGPAPSTLADVPAAQPESPASAFDGDAMWIWLMSRSDGGDPERIAARAVRNGLELVILKAADARTLWTQLDPHLVRTLHRRGLRVCGYQFVYGQAPRAEARVGARIAETGADCLIVDAEGHYEGNYRGAELYMRVLRRRVGRDYPIGLTSFPYVHYHPSFPYSVFLGPGAADFNVPQMYWRAIGTSVGEVFRTTYLHNRVYRRPIYPLGQVWQQPPRGQIRRFRQLAAAYGATGVSWWSWQEALPRDFRSVGMAVPALRRPPAHPGYPLLDGRSHGDTVVWAQQLLLSTGARLRVSARMDAATRRAVRRFDRTHGLLADGVVDAETWEALLAYEPTPVTWRRRGYGVALRGRALRPARRSLSRGADGVVVAPEPPRFPSRANELSGRPRG